MGCAYSFTYSIIASNRSLQYKQLLEVPDSALSLQEQVHYTQNAIAAFCSGSNKVIKTI